MKIERARIILMMGFVVAVAIGLTFAQAQPRELALFEEIPDAIIREYLSPELSLFEEIPVVMLEQQNSEEKLMNKTTQVYLVA